MVLQARGGAPLPVQSRDEHVVGQEPAALESNEAVPRKRALWMFDRMTVSVRNTFLHISEAGPDDGECSPAGDDFGHGIAHAHSVPTLRCTTDTSPCGSTREASLRSASPSISAAEEAGSESGPAEPTDAADAAGAAGMHGVSQAPTPAPPPSPAVEWAALSWPVRSPGSGAAAGAEAASPLTTLMLRNLPNNYTRDMVQGLLDSHGFKGKYNFLYLPIDFRTRAALGYAFVNLATHGDAQRLHERLDGFRGWALPSSKVCSVGWSHPYQGFDAHIARYRNSPLMHEAVPDAWRPIVLADGVRVPFPESTKRVKPPRQGTQRVLR